LTSLPTPNRNRLIEVFLELARQNTPPRNELAAAVLAKRRLDAMGFDTYFDVAGSKVGGNTGNLIAYKKGDVDQAPPIFFSAHFDTVEPTPGLEPIIDGDVIKSGGATIVGADDKCGLAAIIEGMYLLHENHVPHGDIQLILTICEEIGLLGASHVDPSQIRGRYGFVLDSGPPIGSFVYEAPTHDILTVTLRGKAAHAGSSPEEGISAVAIAANAISRMKLGRIGPETTANVGTIHGGTATNIVPEEVVLTCEARSRNPEKLQNQVKHMTDTFNQAAAERHGTCEISIARQYDGYVLGMNDPVLGIAEKATVAADMEFLLRVTGGGSDGNVFNKHGVPTTVMGCGMQNIHRHDEFVKISDMEKSAKLVVSIAATAAAWQG
jgi:tripeptide aminopeptidase